MEFFQNFMKLIPSVFASEPRNDGHDAVLSQNQISVEENNTEGDEVTDQPNVVGKRVKPNISDRPEIYSDVIVENNDSSKYFLERGNVRYKPTWSRILMMQDGSERLTRYNCEKKLYSLIQEEPLVKLLIGALKSSGCPVDIRRNFSCEVCCQGVYGGYDTETQQVVVCQNNVVREDIMATIVTHELIHMFDHCVNNTDFKKPEHLACTEIRAINLTSCSLLDSFWSGYVSLVDLIKSNYGKVHATCVKERALNSVLAASLLSEDEARSVIDRVFPFCYPDLEPIGRRLRHKTTDNSRAYYDGKHYGYV
ncbi:Mitochondrial inner membrane protease ATP23-like protein [Frankliniella fusca]|uniref:Mitochondrial inner membrane protease ATP23 n=1 Tax=Frankliniella fusca TaxID=407009 RepID=A0AAE1H024_9NEOP|nr:Mitochondrial inner membrane protease ATP23-like protein [Frankliniella fusca]